MFITVICWPPKAGMCPLRSAAVWILLGLTVSQACAYLSAGMHSGGVAIPRWRQAGPRYANAVCVLRMKRHVETRRSTGGSSREDADEEPAVKKFGKLVEVSRQKRGDVIGARGAVKVQGKKWENLVSKPPTIRVTGGTAKGRKLSRPDVYLRPMMGKVKEALFSILREFDVLRDDAVCLDTFAGCGSVGIEALSQGIGQAVFVDYSKEACRTIEDNLEHCGFGDRGFVVTSTAEKAYTDPSTMLKRVKRSGFDLVTITPPYEEVDYGLLLNKVVTSKELLRDGAVVVVEYPVELGSLPPRLGSNLIGMRNRKYGRTILAVYCLNPGVDLVPRPDEFGELRDTYLQK